MCRSSSTLPPIQFSSDSRGSDGVKGGRPSGGWRMSRASGPGCLLLEHTRRRSGSFRSPDGSSSAPHFDLSVTFTSFSSSSAPVGGGSSGLTQVQQTHLSLLLHLPLRLVLGDAGGVTSELRGRRNPERGLLRRFPGCGRSLRPAGRRASPARLRACPSQQLLQSHADLTGGTPGLQDGSPFGRWGLLSGRRRGGHI